MAISGGGSISAYSHLALAQGLGVKKALVKPFKKDDLLKAVAEILDS